MARSFLKSTFLIITIIALIVPARLVSPTTAVAAATVHSGTPDDLVNKLIGNGITVDPGTIVRTGHANAFASFTDTDNVFGFTDGIILSTGTASKVFGPNTKHSISTGAESTEHGTPGDTSLSSMTNGETYDAAILEFSFTPTGTEVQFEFVFASDEYNEFIGYNEGNGLINDVFAFFVNDANIALTPDDRPITINTINNTSNAGFFKDNTANTSSIFGLTEMDGFTTVFTVTAPVNAGQPNTVKLAIADGGDPTGDSNVLIKSGSMADNSVSNANPPSVTGATTAEDTQSASGLVIAKNAADGSDVSHYKITDITNGTLYRNDGTTAIANGAYITVAEGNAGLKFTPDADKNTPAGDTFGFKVQAAVGASDTGISSAVDAVVTVTEANDAPTATDDTLPDVAENAAKATIPFAALLGNDVAGPANESGQTLTITAAGNATGGTVAVVGANVEFTPTANYTGPASFEYTVSDNGTTNGAADPKTDTGAAAFAITPTAAAPSLTDATTAEDTQSASGLVLSRNASDGVEVSHFKITAIVGGKLYHNDGTTEIAGGDFITYAEGNAGLKFTPDADKNTPAGDTFGFKVQAAVGASDTGISSAVDAVVTVTEANDPVTATDDTPADAAEDIELTIPFADLLGNDVAGPANESGQTLTITAAGNATGGTVAVVGANVVFTPTPNYSGPAGFEYTVSDNGTTNGAADPKTDTGAAAFTIAPVADTPGVTDAATNESMQTASGLVITRNAADGAEVTHYKITAITNGTLYKTDGRTRIEDGAFITVAEGNAGLKFTPAPGLYSNGSFKFGFDVQAAVGASDAALSAAAKASVTVAEVEDAPSAPSAPAPTAPQQKRQVDVVVDDNGVPAAKVDIIRTQSEQGQQVDNVNFDKAKAAESIGKAVAAGRDFARIVIDDLSESPADEVVVNVPSASVNELSNKGINLEIQTNDVKISLSQEALALLNSDGKDLFFRVVPIRRQEQRQLVETRVVQAEELRSMADGGEVRVIGKPMTIETNYSSRQTKVEFPLAGVELPDDPAELQATIDRMAVYIEHSDGEKAVKRGEIKYDAAGKPIAIEIAIDKFSTFTIVTVEPERTRERYMFGYEDGLFHPDRPITRAETAAILSRNIGAGSAAQEGAYSDVDADHWAQIYIAHMKQQGIMTGDDRGLFRSDSPITRAEMAAIIVSWQRLAESRTASSAADAEGHWAEDNIAAVMNAGLMTGYEDGTFRPDRALTRAEAVSVFNALFDRPALTGLLRPTWPDVPADHWAREAIEAASNSYTAKPLSNGKEQWLRMKLQDR